MTPSKMGKTKNLIFYSLIEVENKPIVLEHLPSTMPPILSHEKYRYKRVKVFIKYYQLLFTVLNCASLPAFWISLKNQFLPKMSVTNFLHSHDIISVVSSLTIISGQMFRFSNFSSNLHQFFSLFLKFSTFSSSIWSWLCQWTMYFYYCLVMAANEEYRKVSILCSAHSWSWHNRLIFSHIKRLLIVSTQMWSADDILKFFNFFTNFRNSNFHCHICIQYEKYISMSTNKPSIRCIDSWDSPLNFEKKINFEFFPNTNL